MGNTYGAHIFKRRQVGQREEVTIKLFKPDGTPLSLSGDAPEGEPDPVMLFKGAWDSSKNYKKYDVVMYNDGDGARSYIFNEDVDSGAPVLNDVNGNPITKFWDPVVNQVDLVLGPDSKVGGGAYVSPAQYDTFAIKVNTPGQIALRCADVLAGSQDLGAWFWHLKLDGTWETCTSDDDGSGSGKPLIRYTPPQPQHVLPGVYGYYLSKYSAGMANAAAHGTFRITLNGDNIAVIGSFADFPADKVTPLSLGTV